MFPAGHRILDQIQKLVPEKESLTDVCKLSILKDEEIMFFAQRCESINDRWLKVIEYIDVCLGCLISPHPYAKTNLAYLDQRDVWTDRVNDRDEVRTSCYVDTDAKVRPFALHGFQQLLGRRI